MSSHREMKEGGPRKDYSSKAGCQVTDPDLLDREKTCGNEIRCNAHRRGQFRVVKERGTERPKFKMAQRNRHEASKELKGTVATSRVNPYKQTEVSRFPLQPLPLPPLQSRPPLSSRSSPFSLRPLLRFIVTELTTSNSSHCCALHVRNHLQL